MVRTHDGDYMDDEPTSAPIPTQGRDVTHMVTYEGKMGYPLSFNERVQKRPLTRLKRLIIWLAILSEGEAQSGLNQWRSDVGKYSGGEAIWHFGGMDKLLHLAWLRRHVYHDMLRREDKIRPLTKHGDTYAAWTHSWEEKGRAYVACTCTCGKERTFPYSIQNAVLAQHWVRLHMAGRF